MLTLPSEITNNKNKQSQSPILLINFEGLDYHIASKSYWINIGSGSDGVVTGGTTFTSATATFQTWNMRAGDNIRITGEDFYEIASVDSETQVTLSTSATNDTGLSWYAFLIFSDLVKRSSTLEIRSSIPQFLDGLSQVGGLNLELLDYRGTLRADLIGSSPDLTDSTVSVYIKYDVNSSVFDQSLSNAIKIFTGVITDYKIHKDIMSISMKNVDPVLAAFPENTILASYPASRDIIIDTTVCKPYQFGDFNLETPFNLYADFGHAVAYAPYCGLSSTNSDLFYVSDHELNEMATTTDLQSLAEPHVFTYRNKLLMSIDIGTVAIDSTSTDCTVDGQFDGKPLYVWLPPTAAATGNQAANPQNAYNGTAAYEVQVSPTSALSIGTFKEQDKLGDLYDDLGSAYDVIISFGDINDDAVGEGRVALYDVATDTEQSYQTFGDDTYNNSTVVILTASGLFNSFDEFYIKCTSTVNFNYYVQQICVRGTFSTTVLDVRNDPIFFKLKGYEYSGTWNSRKTSGNLIQNPADMIEALLRDYWGYGDSNIDMDSFDRVNTILNSVNVKKTFYNQVDAYDLIKEICEKFQLALIYNLSSGKWRLMSPDTANLYFAVSGTSTPGALDIFTDTDTISDNEFTNHAIQKGTFTLSRSTANDVYGKLIINYDFVMSTDEFFKTTTTGSGRSFSINNTFIADSSSATTLRNRIDDWILNQKFIAEFKSFYSAIGHELGDVINIRHDDLNDNMLSATVNTQKWMIVRQRISWHPLHIIFYAIEMP